MRLKRKLKKILSITVSACLVLTNMSFAFTDLTQDHWAKDAVQQMVEKNVLSGYDDGTFRPDSEITRAEFATILVKTLDIKESTTNFEFKDVEGIHWAQEYIDKANSFLTGYIYNNEYYFRPDDAALREDAAVAIVKAKGMVEEEVSLTILNGFKDKNNISDNLKKYVAIAVKNGFMKGNADGTFNPKGHLTRAEVASLFNNIYDYEKIVVGDISKEELPTFKINAEDMSIDFGEEYGKYSVSYSINNKPGIWYKVKEDVNNPHTIVTKGTKLMIGELSQSENIKYIFVRLGNQNGVEYQTIEVVGYKEELPQFYIDEEELSLDLGKNWQKYQVTYGINNPGTWYTPVIKDTIIGIQMPIREDNKIYLMDIPYQDQVSRSNYIFVKEKNNEKLEYVKIEIPKYKEEETKQAYTLKIKADNATVKYPEKVLAGEKVKIEIIPDEGYIYGGANTAASHSVGFDLDENTGSIIYHYFIMPEEDVELELYMSKAYEVKIEADNATVKYFKKASPGSEVTIEIIPDEGYIYEGAKKWNIPVSPVQFKEDKKHNEIFETFIMPEQDVELELYLTKVVEEEPAKDDIAPVVKSIKTDKYYYGNNDDTADITVSGISDKGGAGLNSIFYAYYVPGTENFVDNNILNTESKCTFSIPLTKEGEYEVAVRAIDNEGNASVDSSEDEYLRTTFVYDKTKPEIGKVELVEEGDKIIARITGIKDEGGSGLNSIWYGYYEPEKNEFVYASKENTKEEVEIEFDKTIAGEYHFAVYVVDNASNQSFNQNDPDGFVRAQLTVAN